MFSSIKKIEAVLFARLPNEFRVSGRTNEWLSNHPAGHAEHSLLEGPVFGKDGFLYCVDVIWGRIFKVDSSGNFFLVKQYDGEPNGLKAGEDGSFIIADFKNGILKMDARSMDISPVLNRHKLERFKGVNDLTFAKNGDLFFTDQGLTGLHDSTGRVFRMRKSGNVDCILNNVPSPNGLVVHPNQNILYVAATRSNSVWRVPLMEDGSVAKVGTFIQLSGGVGPDGLAIDRYGRLAVAHFGMGAVWIFSPKGEAMLRINIPGGDKVTNIAFDENEGNTLFITEADSASIYVANLDQPEI